MTQAINIKDLPVKSPTPKKSIAPTTPIEDIIKKKLGSVDRCWRILEEITTKATRNDEPLPAPHKELKQAIGDYARSLNFEISNTTTYRNFLFDGLFKLLYMKDMIGLTEEEMIYFATNPIYDGDYLYDDCNMFGRNKEALPNLLEKARAVAKFSGLGNA